MINQNKNSVSIGERVRELRKWLRITQESVGTYLDIPRSAVSALEANKRDISTKELLELSKLFRCDPNSLLGLKKTPIDYVNLNFQARTNKGTEELEEHDYKELNNFTQFLDEKYKNKPIPQRIPAEDLVSSSNPQHAAEELRKKFKCQAPVDIYSVIESIGIYPRFSALMGLAGAIVRADFSSGEVYGVLVNSDQSEERTRFSMAHELAHYALGHLHRNEKYHSSPKARWKSSIETDADTFAAELLMPRIFIKQELKDNGNITDARVLELADVFLVSYQAMNRRLLDLDCISQVQYEAYSLVKPTKLREKLEKGRKKKSKEFDTKILKSVIDQKKSETTDAEFVNSPDYVRFVQEAACFEYWKVNNLNDRATEVKTVYDKVAMWMADNVPLVLS